MRSSREGVSRGLGGARDFRAPVSPVTAVYGVREESHRRPLAPLGERGSERSTKAATLFSSRESAAAREGRRDRCERSSRPEEEAAAAAAGATGAGSASRVGGERWHPPPTRAADDRAGLRGTMLVEGRAAARKEDARGTTGTLRAECAPAVKS